MTIPSSVEARVSLAYDQKRHDSVQEMLDLGLQEPIYRELFREANALIEHSPRSALVLAVAAGEIAIKSIIAETEGTATSQNARDASPAVDMDRNVLPDISLRRQKLGKLSPPESILSEFQKAVHARNELAHIGTPPIGRNSLIRKLTAIRELLLLVDYCRGFEWAYTQLLPQTIQALEYHC